MADLPPERTYSTTRTGTRSILPADMISVEDARARILDVVPVLPAVETPLAGIADGALIVPPPFSIARTIIDAFLAADQARPKKAVDAGFAAPGSRFTYATGKIVLFSKDKGRVNGAATLR